MNDVAKQKTTLYLDEDLLRQTEATAAGSGRDESAVVEDALRRYLGLEVVGEVWARNTNNALDPDEALALAYAELRDFRAERDAPAAQVRRVVVDPGVLVSAIITPLGPPAEIVRLVGQGRLALIVCTHLLAELLGVLRCEKFRSYLTIEEAERYVAGVASRAQTPPYPQAVAPIIGGRDRQRRR